MGELYYSSEVYEKVAHETPPFVCFYTMVDILPDFSVEFVINYFFPEDYGALCSFPLLNFFCYRCFLVSLQDCKECTHSLKYE